MLKYYLSIRSSGYPGKMNEHATCLLDFHQPCLPRSPNPLLHSYTQNDLIEHQSVSSQWLLNLFILTLIFLPLAAKVLYTPLI